MNQLGSVVYKTYKNRIAKIFIISLLSVSILGGISYYGVASHNTAKSQTPAGTINVRDFGAEPNDPNFDSTEAFKDAIHQSLQTRKSIFVPAGEYYISDTLVLAAPQDNRDRVETGDKTVDMYGEGMASTKIIYRKLNNNGGTPNDVPKIRVRDSETGIRDVMGGIIQIGNGSYAVGGRISNLTIDGQWQKKVGSDKVQDGGGSGIVVYGRSSAQIDNVAIVYTKGKGVATYGNLYWETGGTPRWNTAYAGAFITTNQFLATGQENVYFDYRSVAARIIGNDMQGAGVRDGFRKDINYANIHVHSASDIEIVGNNITEPGGSGIQLSSAVDVVINGNYIHGLGDSAIRADVGGNHVITGNAISFFAERGYPAGILQTLPFDEPKGNSYLSGQAWGGIAILLRDINSSVVSGNTITTDTRPKGTAAEYKPKAAILEDKRTTDPNWPTNYNVITSNAIRGDFSGPSIVKLGANTLVANNTTAPQFFSQAGTQEELSPTPTSTPSPSPTPTRTPTPSPSPTPTPTSTPTPTPTPIPLDPMTVNITRTRVNGGYASSGTVIDAYVGTTKCGSKTMTSSGLMPTSIVVNSRTQQTGCANQGSTITFRISGFQANQTATFASGGSTTISLLSN